MLNFLFGKSNDDNYIYDENYYIDENDHIDIVYKNDRLLHSYKSKFQEIEVYYNKFFGNILVIDNDIQLTEHDEDNYHEMLAHVPLNYIPNAKNVLIIGGGDGGTLRETCKHLNIENIFMIEIDKHVIKIAKKYFKKCASSYDDNRLNLLIQDGAKWVKNNLIKYKDFFDVVLIDSTDYNTAITLFTEEFYKNISEITKINGILSFNCMSLSWEKDEWENTINTMKKYFKYSNLYQVFIPTYASGHYTFCFCSNTIDPLNTPFDCNKFNKKKIDCMYYNPDIHIASFKLPNEFLRTENTERLGTSFMIDIKNCDSNILNNYNKLNEMLENIIRLYKLTKVETVFKKFKPQGISINILLAESHITIHTWPEKKKCTIDLFTCSNFKWTFKKKIHNAVSPLHKEKYVILDLRDIIIKYLNVNKNDIKVNWQEREF
jgi:spermidine synthase